MTIRVVHPGYWKEVHETKQSEKRNQRVFCRCRTCAPARRESCPQNGPHARNADLYLEGWQGGGGEALGRGKKHMAKQLTEQELRQQAVRALSDSLGPVDALRFLGLVSREPFDYQQWRKEYFSHYSVDELLTEVRSHHSGKHS